MPASSTDRMSKDGKEKGMLRDRSGVWEYVRVISLTLGLERKSKRSSSVQYSMSSGSESSLVLRRLMYCECKAGQRSSVNNNWPVKHAPEMPAEMIGLIQKLF